MKLSSRSTLSLLAMFTLAGGLMMLQPRHGAAAQQPAGTLTVTEEEPILAPGKGATLYLGLQTQAADSRSAQSDAQQAMDRLRQGLRSAGVSAAAVQVTGYRIGTSSRAPAAGSTVWQSLQVQVDNQDKLGPAIDAAVASGATVVQGMLNQGVTPNAQQRGAAVAAAVRAARGDAQAIAGALGERLGKPISVEVHMQRGNTPAGSYVMQVRVTFES